jgi:hypothetical protein
VSNVLEIPDRSRNHIKQPGHDPSIVLRTQVALSKRCNEIFETHLRLAEYALQRSWGNYSVYWNRNANYVPAESDVRARLPQNPKSKLLKRANNIGA